MFSLLFYAAIGLDDINGYVLLEDIYDEKDQPKNLDEAIIYMQRVKREAYKLIPLYDKDGETIIGKYKIDYNYNQ